MTVNPAFGDRLEQRRASRRDDSAAGCPAAPDERPCVLVVDDEPEITASVADLLGRDYEVLSAHSADEALHLLEAHRVAVILTDQRMPSVTGAELLARSLDIAPETTRILFTGYSDISAVIDAVNAGHVYHYVTKPWRSEDLKVVVGRGLERYRLVLENRRLLDEVKRANDELEQRVLAGAERLREQNDRLIESEAMRNVAELVGLMGSWRWDVATRISTWSDGMYRLFDVDPGDFDGDVTPVLDARVHPDDRAALDDATANAASGGDAPVEYRVIWRDGSEHLLHGEGTPELDSAGALVAITGYYRDVTEPRRKEAALRDSEREFRTLAEAMPQIVWATRPDGGNIYFNQQWVDYTGMTLEESYGDGWNTPFHPDDRQRAWDAWQRATQDDGPYSLECRLRRADGAYRWWLIRGAPLRDASGMVLEWIGTCTDIEDLKQGERELQQSRALLQAAMDQSQAGIAIADAPDGKLRYVNQAGLFIRGASSAEVVDQVDAARYVASWHILHHDGTPYAADEVPLARAVLYGETSEAEFIIRRDDHEDRIVLARAAPIRDAEGVVTAGVVVFHDITERKQAEDEIRRLNAELEERVVTRTGQLEAANKELEAFAYSVSHDLRAPLRAIDGFSQIVVENAGDRLSEADLEHLQRVRAGAQRMATLIDELLGLSRAARAEMLIEEVDVSRLAAEVLDELQAIEPEREVVTVVQAGMRAQADTALLRTVLANLLGNAWKFTSRHDSARIEVGVEDVSGALAFFVRDDGAGFDTQYAKNLFGAFQRMHQAGQFEGDGIGLAIVQRLVTRMGGRVWADATVERGATFYFTLPGRD